MTEKIYHGDPYCREATAKVSDRENRDDRWRVRLERTLFCPEGGGQPADTGTINGLSLLALESDNDDVIHVLDQDPGEGEARLLLDFERRYDHMQQHTAQHLLSQVLVRRFDAATLSFAIGPEHSSIEIGRPAFSVEEIKALEAECARLVFAALPVRVFETDDLSALHLRKPPKVQGRIRVVEIDGFDQSACGGTHVKSSAEIGPLKILRSERVRAHARLYYAAGTRALRDYQLKHDITQHLQRLVTQPLAEIPQQVHVLIQERDELRRALKKAQRREMARDASAAAAEADALTVREFSGCEPADLRFFATALTTAGKHVLAYSRLRPALEVPTEGPEGSRRGSAYIVIGRGRGNFDLRGISPRLFALLDGKGGGSANLLEGRGNDFSKIGEVVDLLRASLLDPTGPRA